MSKETTEKPVKKSDKIQKSFSKGGASPDDPWISMRTGMIVITVTSVLMAILMAWSAIPTKGIFQGLLWGIGAGIGVWLVFGLAFLFNILVRGKRR